MDDPDPKYGLGLKQGVNRLVEYNSLWPLAFSEEEARIKAALGDRALAIEHYGSTSVPGLRAKPIIDLLVTVENPDDETSSVPALTAVGYELRVRELARRAHRGPGHLPTTLMYSWPGTKPSPRVA